MRAESVAFRTQSILRSRRFLLAPARQGLLCVVRRVELNYVFERV